MSQFYMRFVRYTSTEWKDIYFLTYEDSIEANLLQMVLAKERINLFMKGADADLDEVYKKFGVDYNLRRSFSAAKQMRTAGCGFAGGSSKLPKRFLQYWH